MFHGEATVPLTRRLISGYFLFCLAGLLLCVATAIVLGYRQSLTDNIVLLVLGPATVMMVGAYSIYQHIRVHAVIENELTQVCRTKDRDSLTVRPLEGVGPAIAGWNRLLERLSASESMEQLEDRLAKALDSKKERRFLDVLNALGDGVVVTSRDGAIQFANRAFASLVGATRAEDLDGREILLTLNAAQAANSEQVMASLRQNIGTAVAMMNKGAHAEDGVWRVARQTMQDAERGAVWVWSVRDITQLAIVDEAKNQFVSTATHELRTPLANIKAYAETLSLDSTIDPEKQKEFCNIINQEATRLARFVDEMLSVNQMEVGAMSLDRREVDLERVVQDVIHSVEPQMAAKQIVFETKLPPKYPKLRLDRDKFQAALVNLVGNAAKYTPDGGRVALHLEWTPAEMVIHVEDTGIGISSEELPKVFEKFFRSQDERVRQISGNGLGLTYTQEIVRLHGGRLTAQSELNKGTRFTLTLPIA
jgi:PAS domain S-box-containing protein